ncbi:MAG: ATP-binding protein, partial [Acidimicrobiia bacterium]
VITVNDDGPGIPEDKRESVFQPYERAHSEGTQPASVGLGLTVSRQLARLMDGDLIYREGTSGSSFELSLPSNDR